MTGSFDRKKRMYSISFWLTSCSDAESDSQRTSFLTLSHVLTFVSLRKSRKKIQHTVFWKIVTHFEILNSRRKPTVTSSPHEKQSGSNENLKALPLLVTSSERQCIGHSVVSLLHSRS